MKELKKLDPDLISILAVRCDDKQLNDFDKEEYQDSIFQANKLIAKRYGILNRLKAFNVERFTDDMEIRLTSFSAEYAVKINGHLYTPVTFHKEFNDSDREYYLTQVGNRLLFNFSMQDESNNVEIYYKVDPQLSDYITEANSPIIPNKYQKEQIDFAMFDLAKKGLVRFVKNPEIRAKYEAILQLYQKDERSLDSQLVPNQAGFRVKTWTIF